MKKKKDSSDFTSFQNLCIRILAQSDNCQESQDLFHAAKTIPELVSAWQRYWAGLLHEVPEQVIEAFSKFYPDYRSEIIRAGVYYNEEPPSDTFNSIVLVGDKGSVCGDAVATLKITGRHRVFVLGDLHVSCHGNCNILVNSLRANVDIHDSCRCNIEAGTVSAHDRTIVTGKGNVACYDSSTIYMMGGTLHDHGHFAITAYNDAVVHSFTDRKIILNDKSRLIVA